MPQAAKIKTKYLLELGLYYGLSLCLVLCYQKSWIFNNSLDSLLLFDSLISILTLAFAYRSWTVIKPLLFWHRVKVRELLVLVSLAIILGVLASSIADYLNALYYHRKQSLSFIFWDTPYPKTLAIGFICLQPALIEELGYRGLAIHYLREGTQTKWIALIGSSLLFSFLHLSLLGWLWLFPLGLLLAYFRLKRHSLWYGVIAHFCYNFTILWLEW